MRHLALVTKNKVVLIEWRRRQTSKSGVAYSVIVCEHRALERRNT